MVGQKKGGEVNPKEAVEDVVRRFGQGTRLDALGKWLENWAFEYVEHRFSEYLGRENERRRKDRDDSSLVGGSS
jgi:hypothetical protein